VQLEEKHMCGYRAREKGVMDETYI
jgi:hypothetical protein